MTQPKLPAGEAPFDRPAVDRLLSALDADTVLVGGQALAFWMDRFGIATNEAVVTHDGDVIAGLEQARVLAKALHAKLVVPSARAMTALVAQVRVPTGDGKSLNIDVLHQLYCVGGRRKASEFTRRVIAESIEVTWDRGARFRVMDPFDVLDSRVQNAVGLLDDKGPHVVTQACWAITVARRALFALAEDTSNQKHLGAPLQRIHTLAHSQAGRRLFREHGVDVLDAVDAAAIARLVPRHQPQLRKLDDAITRRRAGARSIT